MRALTMALILGQRIISGHIEYDSGHRCPGFMYQAVLGQSAVPSQGAVEALYPSLDAQDGNSS